MTTEELLLPRVEVIAPYPNSSFRVGTILEKPTNNLRYWGNDEHGYKTSVSSIDIDVHPHLFRPLHWSDKREICDMPEYVKHVEKGFIGKHIKDELRRYSNFTIESDMVEDRAKMSQNFNDYLPATKSEYEQYLISNKKL